MLHLKADLPQVDKLKESHRDEGI